MKCLGIVATLILMVGCASYAHKVKLYSPVKVIMSTSMGDIEIELYQQQAPVTVDNFLRYVDANVYNGGTFYRVVRADNDNGNPQITVIQGDVVKDGKQWPAIELETTKQTGVKHLDGTLSMARNGLVTATSSFFICVGSQPSLDFGGKRVGDGMGFAAFGRVVKGMDVVRRINEIKQAKAEEDPYLKGQMLAHPVVIRSAKRL